MRVRYVVLRHEGVADPHFDLMIEADPGGSLMTWRLAEWPVTGAGGARMLNNHRREYLEYEGELSRGRGRVKRVETGECDVESDAGGGHIQVSPPDSSWCLALRLIRGEQWQVDRSQKENPHRP